MFLLRQVRREDQEALIGLAKILGQAGSISSEKQRLEAQIERSVKSFQAEYSSKAECLYMFVLEDLQKKMIVGSSLIFAKHGTPNSPHTFLKVLKREHKDKSTGIKITHQLLRFEFDNDGPTEIGGLILHPDYRGTPESLGKQLSYSRFAYMGVFPEKFETHVIAELLPPFNSDGSSELWEAFGRRFTGLSYQEADQLSRTNKDFIKNLFPSEDIYTNLFSVKAREVIGKTGDESKAAKHLLEKIGFTYLGAVDPFDGGPHYGAKLKEITIIKKMKRVRLNPKTIEDSKIKALLVFRNETEFFSLLCSHRLEDDLISLPQEVVSLLKQWAADLDDLRLVSPL